MKNITKFLFVLAIAIGCGAYSSSAQVYVSIRPPVPHYVRVQAPSPRHVWVGDEWQPQGGAYVAVQGHWAEPPQPGMVWGAGHWNHGSHGHSWSEGHWQQPHHDHGHDRR